MNARNFTSFFEALHCHPPFPWQASLAETLAATHTWPDVLDLPTGSGKTACIDIALFHWLVAASRGEPALAARRIAFVVDRRIIVDEAAERATKIARTIAEASDGVLAEARELLAANGSDGLGVFTLRGGVARENNLARDPLSVSIVLSTVDQIGSRLLFRGYGVRARMRSLHAGLFGLDTLLLLDEAHISEPFRKTLLGIVREQHRSEARLSGPRPLRWVQLSATPSRQESPARTRLFSLSDEDRSHPVLRRRLEASKPLRLSEVENRDELPERLAKLIQQELAAPSLSEEESPRIGVIVNRVATARALFEMLKKALKKRADVELLIGRVRPLDRDAHLTNLAPKLKSKVGPREGDRPIVIVATQTIEVGADFDFHALYTEAASYPALKQRVGRLNRLGTRSGARGGVVLVRGDATEDPIYGGTTLSTWTMLERHTKDGVVDLGIAAAPRMSPETIPAAPETPELSPSLLCLLVQTSPEPAVAPDVAEFLHGFATQVPDISVVWRDGLVDDTGEIDVERARAIFKVLPPLSTEAMSLPYSTFRQWVSTWVGGGKKVVDSGDMEGDPTPFSGKPNDRPDAQVLVVQGKEVNLFPARRVPPGSLVVVPCSRGGADSYGFNPNETERVRDLALAARMAATRGKPSAQHSDHPERTSPAKRERELVLVWTLELARAWLATTDDVGTGELVALLSDPDATVAEARVAFEVWLDAYAEMLPTDVRSTREALREHRRAEWLGGNGSRFGVVLREGRARSDDLVEGPSLQRTVRVPLTAHLDSVGKLAERYAKGVGLDDALVTALALAGVFHDLGKADPRFQRRLGASDGELLAKSDHYDDTVARGERHEAYSVAVLDQHPELLQPAGEHRALVRYLVGSHHGYGRALQPYAEDAGIAFEVPHGDETLTYRGRAALHGLAAGWADLFADQNRKYGPWMLAYLESILRLADHRRSEQEIDEYERSKERRA